MYFSLLLGLLRFEEEVSELTGIVNFFFYLKLLQPKALGIGLAFTKNVIWHQHETCQAVNTYMTERDPFCLQICFCACHCLLMLTSIGSR